jgi:hypothetical protein
MTYEEVTDQSVIGDASPLPEGDATSVYRLEIKNLFANGDFEDTAVGDTPAGWTDDSNGTAEVIDASVEVDGDSATDDNIDGKSFWVILGDPSEPVFSNVSVDLPTQLADGYDPSATYRFYFDMRSQAQNVGIEINAAPLTEDQVPRWNISRPQAACARGAARAACYGW